MSGKAGMIATLGDMGFGPNRAARALQATGSKVGVINKTQKYIHSALSLNK